MKKAIYSFIYYRLLGWKTNVTVPNYDKCVICAAPHTTNLDLFIGKLFYGAIGRKTSFMMKKTPSSSDLSYREIELSTE